MSNIIASLKPHFIKILQKRIDLEEVAVDIYNITAFATCCGASDCTHIKIISPDKAE